MTPYYVAQTDPCFWRELWSGSLGDVSTDGQWWLWYDGQASTPLPPPLVADGNLSWDKDVILKHTPRRIGLMYSHNDNHYVAIKYTMHGIREDNSDQVTLQLLIRCV